MLVTCCVLFWSDSSTPPPSVMLHTPHIMLGTTSAVESNSSLLHNLSIVFQFQFGLLSECYPLPTPSSLIPLFVIPSVRWQAVKTRSDNNPLSFSFSLMSMRSLTLYDCHVSSSFPVCLILSLSTCLSTCLHFSLPTCLTLSSFLCPYSTFSP